MMHRTLVLARVVAVVAAVVFAARLSAAEPAETPFTAIVMKYFAAWDRSGDGVLQTEEIDELVIDAGHTGEIAAAVGALKTATRSTRYTVPDLTGDYFRDYAARSLARERLTPDFDRLFRRGQAKIAAADRSIFAEGMPSLETARQGALGNCFFIAVVGAAVARDPRFVVGMVEEHDEGYTVSFGNGQAITVPSLTEAELAMNATSGRSGLWLPVVEKAFGALRTGALPAERRTSVVTDSIARGGSGAASIRVLTGNSTSSMRLRAAERDETDVEGLLPRLRERLKAAFEGERLVVASTPAPPTGVPAPPEPPTEEMVTPSAPAEARPAQAPLPFLPAGMHSRHLYAVLGYDEATDTVQVWNPHGNSHRPRGAPGLRSGYATEGGRFSVPLAEFVMVFRSVTIENAPRTASPR